MVWPVVKRDMYTLIFTLTPHTRMPAVIFRANRLKKYQLLQGFRRSVKNPEITQFALGQFLDLIYSLIPIFRGIKDIQFDEIRVILEMYLDLGSEVVGSKQSKCKQKIVLFI